MTTVIRDTTAPLKRGNWTDSACYYISVIDGAKYALVAGPFKNHEQALGLVEQAKKVGYTRDPMSHFYAWGTCKRPNGYQEGVLNTLLGI